MASHSCQQVPEGVSFLPQKSARWNMPRIPIIFRQENWENKPIRADEPTSSAKNYPILSRTQKALPKDSVKKRGRCSLPTAAQDISVNLLCSKEPQHTSLKNLPAEFLLLHRIYCWSVGLEGLMLKYEDIGNLHASVQYFVSDCMKRYVTWVKHLWQMRWIQYLRSC